MPGEGTRVAETSDASGLTERDLSRDATVVIARVPTMTPRRVVAQTHPMTDTRDSPGFRRLHRQHGPVGLEQDALGVAAEQELADPGAAP